MRGPGRSRTGRNIDRLGLPCPAEYADFLMAKEFGFQMMPADLTNGSTDDQPADTYLRMANILSEASRMTEELQLIQQRKNAGGKR